MLPIQSTIPMNVQSLIADAIDSVGALELLLLLYHEPEREWDRDELAAQLRVAVDWTRHELRVLSRAGLICETGKRSKRYRYYPASMEMNAAVAELARSYAQRPLAMISFIHSRPIATLRRFASAFRIRSDDEAC